MEERLQKIIARAGIASRRRAEEMMASGLVTVNGRVVTELGTKADESRDHIKVAGKLLRHDAERVYLLLHKPPEVVSTLSDPEGRRSLRDLLHGIPERVFPVGRLEYHSSGLVFLTNDGDLANRILKARNVPQVYQLKLKTLLTFEEIETSRAHYRRPHLARARQGRSVVHRHPLRRAARCLAQQALSDRSPRRKAEASQPRESRPRFAAARRPSGALTRRSCRAQPRAGRRFGPSKSFCPEAPASQAAALALRYPFCVRKAQIGVPSAVSFSW